VDRVALPRGRRDYRERGVRARFGCADYGCGARGLAAEPKSVGAYPESVVKKSYIVLDLAAFHGGAIFIPGREPLLSDKPTLERQCATTLLQHVRAASGLDVQNIRSNPSDPPDIFFESNSVTIGIEVVQIVPENRRGKDHQLNALRGRILDRLPIGELTRDWAVNIILADSYAPRISIARDADDHLATVIAGFLRQPKNDQREYSLAVPETLRRFVHALSAMRSSLGADPRLRELSAPLIIFSVQGTKIVPDDDFPVLLDAIVLPKMKQDLAGPTWLLMWSSHHSLLPMTDELVAHMERWLFPFSGTYDRMFYLANHTHGTLTEFYSGPGARRRDA
jgi:hypothetical protein